jgi:hypothetical protein
MMKTSMIDYGYTTAGKGCRGDYPISPSLNTNGFCVNFHPSSMRIGRSRTAGPVRVRGTDEG